MNQEHMQALEQIIEKDYGNTAGIIIQQNGTRVYEKYFHGFAAGDAVHVASVTKSVFSALIGIALDRGCIASVQQKVLDFFPAYTPPPEEHMLQEVTLEHLLTMTAPYKCREEPYEAFFTSENWVRTALDLLGGEERPGTFRYAPIVGAHILSGILANATGRPILDFAMENLFAPLGIEMGNVVFHSAEEQLAWYEKTKHGRGWVVDPQGLNAASWGLTLTPADMANIGQLYLNGGLWNGKQLIPPGWVAESTRTHSRWDGLCYGYLWWILDENGPVYAAMGDGGNMIYINPEKALVVSIAALFMPNARDRRALILEHIEPFLGD